VKLDIFGQSEKLAQIEQSTKAAFSKVKEELDEHLEAINQNTSESQAQSEQLKLLEQKVDKLSEKLEHLLELLGTKHVYRVEPLTLREQEVFIALYTMQEYKLCTAKLIAYKTGLPVPMIDEVIDALITKGVPIYRRDIDGEYELILDPLFKQEQAKSNIIQLNKDMVRHVTQSN
jgi:signal transduction histidine kinase